MGLVQQSLLLTPVLLVGWLLVGYLVGWLVRWLLACLLALLGASEYGQFQRLSHAVSSCLHCALRSLQAGWNVSISKDTAE